MVDPSINEREGKLDRLQLVALAVLMIIGTMFVYSATQANSGEAEKAWYAQIWFRQVIWYALGAGAGAAACMVNYHTLARWSFVIYWLMILCLLTVLIPHVGSVRGGARRWIDLPLFQFKPS
jgi:cell division protein FtsW (lipid II flippase)